MHWGWTSLFTGKLVWKNMALFLCGNELDFIAPDCSLTTHRRGNCGRFYSLALPPPSLSPALVHTHTPTIRRLRRLIFCLNSRGRLPDSHSKLAQMNGSLSVWNMVVVGCDHYSRSWLAWLIMQSLRQVVAPDWAPSAICDLNALLPQPAHLTCILNVLCLFLTVNGEIRISTVCVS